LRDRTAAAEAALRAAVDQWLALTADYPSVPRLQSELLRSRIQLCLLLAASGRPAEAVDLADSVAATPAAARNALYDCACAMALASAAPHNPEAGAHAARAVAVLRQAIAKGYGDVPHLLRDADLAPLRRRADYAALLWDLADASPR
jgi:hypothetical protein